MVAMGAAVAAAVVAVIPAVAEVAIPEGRAVVIPAVEGTAVRIVPQEPSCMTRSF